MPAGKRGDKTWEWSVPVIQELLRIQLDAAGWRRDARHFSSVSLRGIFLPLYWLRHSDRVGTFGQVREPDPRRGEMPVPPSVHVTIEKFISEAEPPRQVDRDFIV